MKMMMNQQKTQIMNQMKNFILAITLCNALQNLKLQLKLKDRLLASLKLQILETVFNR